MLLFVIHDLQRDLLHESSQGYQSFAEACGRLEMTELRDTFIRQLSSFVFTIPEDGAEAGPTGCYVITGALAGVIHVCMTERVSASASMAVRVWVACVRLEIQYIMS